LKNISTGEWFETNATLETSSNSDTKHKIVRGTGINFLVTPWPLQKPRNAGPLEIWLLSGIVGSSIPGFMQDCPGMVKKIPSISKIRD